MAIYLGRSCNVLCANVYVEGKMTPVIDQVAAKLVQARDKPLLYDIHHLLILFGIRKKISLKCGRSELWYLFIISTIR
jgi:hypothetical protein